MRSRVLSACMAGAMAVSGGGCSWAFMKRPMERRTVGDPVECTSAKAAPILDTICSSYFVLNTAALVATETCSGNPYSDDADCVEKGTRAAGIGLSLGIATLCAVSAATGYSSARRCKLLKRGWSPSEPPDVAPGSWPEPAEPPPATPALP